MRVYSQRAATFALLLFSISLLSVGVSLFGGTGEQMSRPTSLEARASETRQARIRQLMLESEEGHKFSGSEQGDGGDQEKMDGEDEQQGGIEAVTWGPGWGPEMDKAFGSQPIDEKNYDLVQPSGDGKAALSQMDSQIEQVQKHIRCVQMSFPPLLLYPSISLYLHITHTHTFKYIWHYLKHNKHE
jgi:hypothetical protein